MTDEENAVIQAAITLSYLPHRYNYDYFDETFMDAVDRVIEAAEKLRESRRQGQEGSNV